MKEVRDKLEAELRDLDRELTIDLPREIKIAGTVRGTVGAGVKILYTIVRYA